MRPSSALAPLRRKQSGAGFESISQRELQGRFAVIDPGSKTRIGSGFQENFQALEILSRDRVMQRYAIVDAALVKIGAFKNE